MTAPLTEAELYSIGPDNIGQLPYHIRVKLIAAARRGIEYEDRQDPLPPTLEAQEGELIFWNEPLCLKPGFVANSICQATEAEIITAQKGNFPERNYTDQEALDEFMVVHWAWRSHQPSEAIADDTDWPEYVLAHKDELTEPPPPSSEEGNEQRHQDISAGNDSGLRDNGTPGANTSDAPTTLEALTWDNGRKPADHPPIRMMSAAEGVDRGFIGYGETEDLCESAVDGSAAGCDSGRRETASHQTVLGTRALPIAPDTQSEAIAEEGLGARTAKLIEEELAPAMGMKFVPDAEKIADFDGRPRPSDAIAEESEIRELVEFLDGCEQWLRDEGVLQNDGSEPRFKQAATALEASEIEKEKWRAEADCHRHERNIVNSKLTQAMGEIEWLTNDLRMAIMSDSSMCKILEDATRQQAEKIDRLEAECERRCDQVDEAKAALAKAQAMRTKESALLRDTLVVIIKDLEECHRDNPCRPYVETAIKIARAALKGEE